MRWIWTCLLIASGIACGDDGDGDATTASSGPGNVASAASTGAASGGAGQGGATASTGVGGQGGAGSSDTWGNFAQAWFGMYCTSCHPGMPNNMRDYALYAEVVTDAATIRCGVAPTALTGCTGSPAPNQFPIGTGPNPDATSRQRLVAWIDAGMVQ